MRRLFIATTAIALAVASVAPASAQTGLASVYSTKEGSTRTASGIRLRDGALTAAHKTLPLGSRARVTNKKNGRSVIVKITDRGPFVRGRIIDLTLAAARLINIMGLGLVEVTRL